MRHEDFLKSLIEQARGTVHKKHATAGKAGRLAEARRPTPAQLSRQATDFLKSHNALDQPQPTQFQSSFGRTSPPNLANLPTNVYVPTDQQWLKQCVKEVDRTIMSLWTLLSVAEGRTDIVPVARQAISSLEAFLSAVDPKKYPPQQSVSPASGATSAQAGTGPSSGSNVPRRGGISPELQQKLSKLLNRTG